MGNGAVGEQGDGGSGETPGREAIRPVIGGQARLVLEVFQEDAWVGQGVPHRGQEQRAVDAIIDDEAVNAWSQ